MPSAGVLGAGGGAGAAAGAGAVDGWPEPPPHATAHVDTAAITIVRKVMKPPERVVLSMSSAKGTHDDQSDCRVHDCLHRRGVDRRRADASRNVRRSAVSTRLPCSRRGAR